MSNYLRIARRRENYDTLRKARFSSKFCNKFKDHSRADVGTLAYLKEQSDLVLINQIYALTGVRMNVKDIY